MLWYDRHPSCSVCGVYREILHRAVLVAACLYMMSLLGELWKPLFMIMKYRLSIEYDVCAQRQSPLLSAYVRDFLQLQHIPAA